MDVVSLNGTRATVSIPERMQISGGGNKRPVLRGTYFVCNGIELIPLSEETAEIVEQNYQLGRWNSTVSLPDKKHYILIKGIEDIRRYESGTSGDSPFLPVQRGFPG